MLVAIPFSLFVNPAARSGTAPYNLIARCFTPLVVRQPCGTVGNRSLQPRCSSTLRRARGPRPTTSLFGNPAERLETVPYNLVARLLCGALGDRALQPRCSCPPLEKSGTVGNRSLQPRCSLLVARCFSLLVAYLLKNGKPTSSRGRVSIYEGAMIRKAGK